jgi:hypothetical protein
VKKVCSKEKNVNWYLDNVNRASICSGGVIVLSDSFECIIHWCIVKANSYSPVWLSDVSVQAAHNP